MPQRQYQSINTVSVAGEIVGKISHWTSSEGRAGCAFLVETLALMPNKEGKMKEVKNKILCKAFGEQAEGLKHARTGSRIMVSYGNVVGGKVKPPAEKERYEQFVRIVEWSFSGGNPKKQTSDLTSES